MRALVIGVGGAALSRALYRLGWALLCERGQWHQQLAGQQRHNEGCYPHILLLKVLKACAGAYVSGPGRCCPAVPENTGELNPCCILLLRVRQQRIGSMGRNSPAMYNRRTQQEEHRCLAISRPPPDGCWPLKHGPWKA